MTFEELERKLPNGFHDGKIRWIKADYENSSLTIGMKILVGEPDTPNPDEYRTGVLRVQPFYLCTVEPPDSSSLYLPDGDPIWIEGEPVKPGENSEVDQLVSALPKDASAYRFFLRGPYSFLYLAGQSVSFAWDDGSSMA